MELLQGSRDKEAMQIAEKQLKAWGVSVIHGSEAVSVRATQLIREFTLSHSVQAMDALIAATAIEAGETPDTLKAGSDATSPPTKGHRASAGMACGEVEVGVGVITT